MELTDYCNCDICIALQQMGYNEPSEYTWVHNCRVSDEILVKHPGLSDSGYMDLIDEYDGPYKREEVYHTYIEPIKRFSRNSLIDTDFGEICSCVHLYEAQTWLRKNKQIHISITLYMEGYAATIKHFYVFEGEFAWKEPIILQCRKSQEEALLEGIKEAVKLLKEEK